MIRQTINEAGGFCQSFSGKKSYILSNVYVTHHLDEAVRLADRVVALSRRPGQVREIVRIPIPRSQRAADDPRLAVFRERLWQLIREEAIAADQEISHGR